MTKPSETPPSLLVHPSMSPLPSHCNTSYNKLKRSKESCRWTCPLLSTCLPNSSRAMVSQYKTSSHSTCTINRCTRDSSWSSSSSNMLREMEMLAQHRVLQASTVLCFNSWSCSSNNNSRVVGQGSLGPSSSSSLLAPMGSSSLVKPSNNNSRQLSSNSKQWCGCNNNSNSSNLTTTSTKTDWLEWLPLIHIIYIKTLITSLHSLTLPLFLTFWSPQRSCSSAF